MAAGEEYAPVEESVQQAFTPGTFSRFTDLTETATGTDLKEYNGDDVAEETLRTWADHGFVELERDNGDITGYGVTIRGYLAAEQDHDLVNGQNLKATGGYNDASTFVTAHRHGQAVAAEANTALQEQYDEKLAAVEEELDETDVQVLETVLPGLAEGQSLSDAAEHVDVLSYAAINNRRNDKYEPLGIIESEGTRRWTTYTVPWFGQMLLEHSSDLSAATSTEPESTDAARGETYQITDNVDLDAFLTFVETLGTGEPRSAITAELDKSHQTVANWYNELKQEDLFADAGKRAATTYFLLPETREMLETYADEHDLDPDAFHYLDPEKDREQIQAAAAAGHLLDADLPNLSVRAEERDSDSYASNVSDLADRFLNQLDDAVPRAQLLQQYTTHVAAADDGPLTFDNATPDAYPENMVDFQQYWDDLLALAATAAADRGLDDTADLLDTTADSVEARLDFLEKQDMIRYVPDGDGPAFYFNETPGTNVRRAMEEYGLDVDGFDLDGLTFRDFSDRDPLVEHRLDTLFESEEELRYITTFAELTKKSGYIADYTGSSGRQSGASVRKAADMLDEDVAAVAAVFEELEDRGLVSTESSNKKFVFDEDLKPVLSALEDDHGYTINRLSFRDVEQFTARNADEEDDSGWAPSGDDGQVQAFMSYDRVRSRREDASDSVSSPAPVPGRGKADDRTATAGADQYDDGLTSFDDLTQSALVNGIRFEPGVTGADALEADLQDAVTDADMDTVSAFLEDVNDYLEDQRDVYVTQPENVGGNDPLSSGGSDVVFPVGRGRTAFQFDKNAYHSFTDRHSHLDQDDTPFLFFEYSDTSMMLGLPEADQILGHFDA